MVFSVQPARELHRDQRAQRVVDHGEHASVLAPEAALQRRRRGADARSPHGYSRLAALGDRGTHSPPDGRCRSCSSTAGADSTVSYMGANIYPLDVEYGLYRDGALAAAIEGFCLEGLTTSGARVAPGGSTSSCERPPRSAIEPSAAEGRLRGGGRRAPRRRRTATSPESLREDTRRRPIFRRRAPRSRNGAIRRHRAVDQERVLCDVVEATDLSKAPRYERAQAPSSSARPNTPASARSSSSCRRSFACDTG